MFAHLTLLSYCLGEYRTDSMAEQRISEMEIVLGSILKYVHEGEIIQITRPEVMQLMIRQVCIAFRTLCQTVGKYRGVRC